MENNAALLIMDVQSRMLESVTDQESYLQKLQLTIDAARAVNIPIIYVVVGFRRNLPDFNPRSKGLRALRDSGAVDTLINPKPVLPLSETDIVVTRRRVSGFTGSDLEIVLRTMKIEHLVLTGLSTSGVVLSTLRDAVDRDYTLTVLSDLCADRDEEVHRVLVEKFSEARRSKVLNRVARYPALRSFHLRLCHADVVLKLQNNSIDGLG